MRHEAILDLPIHGDKSGKPERAHLRVAARKGNARAIQRLRNPHPYPEALRYLHRWSLELHERSGASELGMNGLTWTTLDAWARQTGRAPDSAEIEALFALDHAMRSAGDR